MPDDKSLFYYGKLYNRLFDPMIKPARAEVVKRVAHGSSVLDVGCGTGILCFELRREKECSVVGIDLSRRMLDYAESINPFDNVEFLHQDAAEMNDISDNGFDFVLIVNVIHELNPGQQTKILSEALRVGQTAILVDSNVPLPWNAHGIVKRLIEISFGYDHYHQFQTYIRSGGIMGILQSTGLQSEVVDRSIFSRGSNQIVAVSG